MGYQLEIYKDPEGNNHLLFDKSAFYKDSEIGEKLSDFEILRVLGSFNGENIISKVRSLKNNKIYAMKKIELNKMKNEEEKQLCLDQMEKLKIIKHPHLLQYYKTFKDENNNLYMIYEYMNNSDLNSFIKAHQYSEKNIKEEEIWNILLQCLSGLEYLHKENLAHLAIRPTNIFLNNEQNSKLGLLYDTPKLEDKNYDIKNDIYFIGIFFYKMCFSEYEFVKASAWVDDCDIQKINNNFYSKELLNIIYEMLNEDPNQRKSASELYNIVKREYVRKYENNTSINSVLRCLYSFKEFTKEIIKSQNYIEENKEKFYISYWYLKTINALSQNTNINECLEEFRRALASGNSKLEGSKEVDPVYLISFLFEKMHKEFIKNNKSEIKPKNLDEQYIINSIYKVEEEEDKSNKQLMLNKFLSYFKVSKISNLFFGFMKKKRNCDVCKNGSYSFSNFCLMPFDLTKFEMTNNQFEFNLINDGFHKGYIEEKILDNVYCDRCLTEQKHFEFNRIYSCTYHMIICFYRGRNYKSNINIDFPEFLDISNYVEEKLSPTKFYLVGSINRCINNGKEEFIYFAKDPNQLNVWKSSYGDGNLSGAPINIIKKYGQIMMLFYCFY